MRNEESATGTAAAPSLPRSDRGGAAFVALALLALAAVAIWIANLGGTFLSDDFAHLAVIHGAHERSALGAWVVARFFEPLGNGTFAYRPLAFATYALDWTFYGTDAVGWRLTSVLLFAANALAAGLLVHRWLAAHAPQPRFAAAFGGLLLAAYPFAGEISYWLVGRFDLLACLFSLLFLLSLPLHRPSTTREHALRLAFLACALWSKESVLPLPAIATLIVFSAAATGIHAGAAMSKAARTTVRELAPSWLLLGAYLVWRYALFGSFLKVYRESTPPRALEDVWIRLSGLRDIVLANAGAHAHALTLAAAALIAVIVVANLRGPRDAGDRRRALVPPLVAGVALYIVAPALSFPVSSASGEGARHFYMAWLYVSLLGAMLVGWSRGARPLGVALLALLLVAQANSLRQWHSAGSVMADVVAGVGRVATTVPEDRYALLLLPDHIGVALFARTAQASIVGPPMQSRDYLPRMAPMLGIDFGHWSTLIADGEVARLKSAAAFDPVNFVGLFCWNPARRSFVPLTDGSLAREPARWEAAARANFAPAGCVEPF